MTVRTALVTGGAGGIGRALVEALAARRHRVIVHGIEPQPELDAFCAEVTTRHGVEAVAMRADAADPAEVLALCDTALARFGTIDILVNNAGIQHVAPVHAFPLEMWHRILAVDLTCAFLTTRALLPGMRAQRWGRIVNTCSVHALVGSPMKAAYTAAKHGLAGLTKVVALEAAADSVTCNGFCPGWTRTPILDQQIDLRAARFAGDREAAAADLLREKQPSLTFVEPADLGEIVAFLCSDAAAQITGVILPVDGGWTAQ